MKKILIYSIMALFAVACDTQPDASLPGAEKAPILNILTPTATFESEGGTTEVKIVSTNDWTARLVHDNSANKEQWCSVNVTSGKGDETVPSTIRVAAEANTTYAERTATIYVTSSNYNKSIKITQKQLDVLNITTTQYNVTAAGDIVNVEVKCNVVAEVTFDSSIDWVKRIDNTSSGTRAYATMQYRFEVAPNTTGAERQAVIKFVYKNIEKSITIIQAAE